MNKLKTSFKNYLSAASGQPGGGSNPNLTTVNTLASSPSSTNSSSSSPSPNSPAASTPSPSKSATLPKQASLDAANSENGSANADLISSPVQSRASKLSKSINESTKRISNLLQFKSPAVDQDAADAEQNHHLKKAYRPKFLRSNTAQSFRISRKKTDTTLGANGAGSEFGTAQHLTKKQLIQSEDLNPESIFLTLNADLGNLMRYFYQIVATNSNSSPDSPPWTIGADLEYSQFMETSEVSPSVYFSLMKYAKDVLNAALVVYNQVENNAIFYDYDHNLKSNGYRSILRIFDNCCRKLLLVLYELNDKKARVSSIFQTKLMATNLRELQTWIRLMEKIHIVLQLSLDMQHMTMGEFRAELRDHSQDDLANEAIARKEIIKGPSLFIDAEQLAKTQLEQTLFDLATVHQEAFYGRACGFQFCDSLQMPLTGCAIALTSYNDGYSAFSNTQSFNSHVDQLSGSLSISSNGTNNTNISNFLTSTIGQAAFSVFSSTKYIMDPDLRSRRMSHIVKTANVEFCKAFWQLTETSIVQMGSNLVTPNLAINVVKKISLTNPLRLPRVKSLESPEGEQNLDYVEIKPPTSAGPGDTVKIRILSHEMLPGMQNLDKLQTIESPVSFNSYTHQESLSQYSPSGTTNNTTANGESAGGSQEGLSRFLILHAHGGGFIAHSSKSHEIYLKPWCKELKVPIVSIDYSLAPEYPFPRASEECFYVYAWCLLNKHLLGWTGERIICVGDSAGGVLVTNVVQRAINNNIRVPDALVPIYTPFLLTFSLSPSRLMSVMDPLLNMGILWRCLAAYCGIDFKAETETYRACLSITEENYNSTNSNVKLARSVSKTTTKSSPPSSSSSFKFSSGEDKVVFENSTTDIHLASSNILIDIEPLAEETKSKQSVPQSNVQSKPNGVNQVNTESIIAEKERLLKYHSVMGDAIFLIETLRNHSLPKNEYMSPLMSSDQVLAKFPKTCLISCNDPFLDDNIQMAHRFRQLGLDFEMAVVDNGTPHGFLNMRNLANETQEAFDEISDHLHRIMYELESEEEQKTPQDTN